LPPSPPQRPAHRAGRNPPREWRERVSRPASPRALEGAHELAIPALDIADRLFASDLLRAPGYQWVPEAGAAYREPDESRDGPRGGEPFVDFSIIFTATQYDAANAVASAPPGSSDNLFAILATVEALDFPDVRFDTGI